MFFKDAVKMLQQPVIQKLHLLFSMLPLIKAS